MKPCAMCMFALARSDNARATGGMREKDIARELERLRKECARRAGAEPRRQRGREIHLGEETSLPTVANRAPTSLPSAANLAPAAELLGEACAS